MRGAFQKLQDLSEVEGKFSETHPDEEIHILTIVINLFFLVALFVLLQIIAESRLPFHCANLHLPRRTSTS